jgi:hypothetical protein
MEAEILQQITVRSFRAGFATMLYCVGTDPMLIARVPGHCDFRAIERYIASNDAYAYQAVENSIPKNHSLNIYGNCCSEISKQLSRDVMGLL